MLNSKNLNFMSLNNLISLSFSDEEFSQIENALSTLEQIIAPKTVNLTPEEKQSLGRIGNRMSHWIENYSKAKDIIQKIPPDSEYYPAAAWYTGLIEIKEGNINKAIKYLDAADESLIYINKADRLREDVQKIKD